MGKIELIQEAITKAANNESKLIEGVIQIPSFSSKKIKHLLNNLGEIGTTYLEVGIHKAGTFVAANYENYIYSIGVDNYSELEQGGLSKEMAYQARDTFLNKQTNIIVEEDFFSYMPETVFGVKPGFDFYLYDGSHGEEAQCNALVHPYDLLADEFIFCVDDSSWQQVKIGTRKGILKSNFEIIFEQHLWDGKENGKWHNGFSVYLLKKNK